jgi:uncharacterized RDD family membrane protein YckC
LEIILSEPPNAGLSLGPLVDQLTIETPEQTSLDFAVAGIGSRFLAIAYDVIIQSLVAIIVGVAGSLIIRAIVSIMPRASMWGMAILLLFYFFLYFGYYAVFEIIWNGQTPGKRKAGIRVIKDSGRPLTPAESIGRNLMRIVDWLPSFYGVGLACAFFTKGNKRLGDLVVGSIVVREISLNDLKPIAPAASSSGSLFPATLGQLGAINLSADEFLIIESFLNRRSALEPYVRYRMADEVLRRIKPKLNLPGDSSISSEKILEALAYERHSTGAYS